MFLMANFAKACTIASAGFIEFYESSRIIFYEKYLVEWTLTVTTRWL
jgi:hypothetical protein